MKQPQSASGQENLSQPASLHESPCEQANPSGLDNLAALHSLIVQQKTHWSEALLGVEKRNAYDVCDAVNNKLYQAHEYITGGQLQLGWTVGTFRVDIERASHKLLRLHKPPRMYFHRLDVLDGQSRPLGSIARRFSVWQSLYAVSVLATGDVLYLCGWLLQPWTFHIVKDGRVCGAIRKQWTNLAQELFTDADTYRVTFPRSWDVRWKALCLSAVFLIDFVYFEKRRYRPR